jgi:hypothetical protein
VRHRKANLRARVNGDLALRFTAEGLTSHSGLEIFRLYLVRLDFAGRLRRRLKAVDPGADYSSVDVIRVFIAMLVIGARRLSHVRYLGSDPVVQRFVELRVFPSDRTLARWLSRCKASVRSALLAFMMELIGDSLRPLRLRRLTIDVDGTVLSTGLQVERAFRGYNPHHRKVPSYYPITAYLAQTGHVLSVRNRSGNVHDGKASMSFFRDLFADIRAIEPNAILEVRLDGAFFRREILAWLESRAEYAIRVPFYQWIDLKGLVALRQRWEHIAPGLDGFFARVHLAPWKRDVQVAIYRKKVQHPSCKNYQLDLFDPSNGYWEYSAITTNKRIGLGALWQFLAGRGTHEKVLGQLKTGFAFDAIPTLDYAANSTWQVLSALAYNLVTSFQIATSAPRLQRSRKRTALFLLKSIHTLRYEFLNKAGIVQRPNGRPTLTLSKNPATKEIVTRLLAKLDRAA